MHKISLISSVILFLLGCITLGAAIICSDILPQILKIYLISHPITYTDEILHIHTTNIYFLALAELILGTFGYLYHRKKV